ncbi:hypothetical protein MN116_000537 [Schistosoma mekongi]|uniref:Uncharacterized protein n=1 Tax=Schistosoma mekongi TaxID=38744 RepID=A0AAE1ZE80_SCHME|nr:hypothetical protein MN116_000537 [Schistosoma mekongi]
MTIEIRDGIYNTSGPIDDGVQIYKKVYPASSIVGGRLFTLIPKPRCLSQTSEMTCRDESQPKASCTWCPDCAKCVHNTSSCECSKQTSSIESQTNDLDDYSSSKNYQSTEATSGSDDKATEISTAVYEATKSTKNTNDNNDTTTEDRSLQATSQSQAVEHTKVTTSSQSSITHSNLYILIPIIVVCVLLYIFVVTYFVVRYF